MILHFKNVIVCLYWLLRTDKELLLSLAFRIGPIVFTFLALHLQCDFKLNVIQVIFLVIWGFRLSVSLSLSLVFFSLHRGFVRIRLFEPKRHYFVARKSKGYHPHTNSLFSIIWFVFYCLVGWLLLFFSSSLELWLIFFYYSHVVDKYIYTYTCTDVCR